MDTSTRRFDPLPPQAAEVLTAALEGREPRSLRVSAYIALLYGAGLGTHEVPRLARGDYRARERLIVVRPRPGRDADWRAREVPLLPRVLQAVDRYLAREPAPDDAPILADAAGRVPHRVTLAYQVGEECVRLGLPPIQPIRFQDAYARAVWAAERRAGHAECLLGLARSQFHLGRVAFRLPDLEELARFLAEAHPWGPARGGRAPT